MLRVGVLVSGGGTNLRAISDAVDHGDTTNARISAIIGDNPRVHVLERAGKHGIQAICISPEQFPAKGAFSQVLLVKVDEYDLDLIVLARLLVATSAVMTEKYEGRITNIHPSLVPSFCGVGYYGLRAHEAVLARGVKVTGATAHYVDGGMDTDLIILQKVVEVGEGDTPEILQGRVMEQAERMTLPRIISMIADGQ